MINNIFKIAITGVSLGIILLITTNCGDSLITPDRKIDFPDSNVSYQNHVQLFLNFKCAYRGCHSVEEQKDGRIMTDYFNLFSTANVGLIIPNNPEESRIIQILRGNPRHRGTYEFPAGYFSDDNINGMVTWIKEGAKFN
ncbi:MAG: hypothetical protein V1779_16040 [bacterium]